MRQACRTYLEYLNAGKQATPAYVEDELELPILIPTTFLHQRSCLLQVEETLFLRLFLQRARSVCYCRLFTAGNVSLQAYGEC